MLRVCMCARELCRLKQRTWTNDPGHYDDFPTMTRSAKGEMGSTTGGHTAFVPGSLVCHVRVSSAGVPGKDHISLFFSPCVSGVATTHAAYTCGLQVIRGDAHARGII